eukprot:2077262-Rhodomonas_salina.4
MKRSSAARRCHSPRMRPVDGHSKPANRSAHARWSVALGQIAPAGQGLHAGSVPPGLTMYVGPGQMHAAGLVWPEPSVMASSGHLSWSRVEWQQRGRGLTTEGVLGQGFAIRVEGPVLLWQARETWCTSRRLRRLWCLSSGQADTACMRRGPLRPCRIQPHTPHTWCSC